MTRTTTRCRIGLASALLTTLALGVPASASATSPASGNSNSGADVDPGLRADQAGNVRIVVRVTAGTSGRVELALRRLGGQVMTQLPIIGGFAATLPAAEVSALAEVEGVEVISANRPVSVQGGAPRPGKTEMAPRVTEAPKAWSAGLSGQGVTVALLDTGVAAVPEIVNRMVPVEVDATGKTASCYDLSGEGNCEDSYGHGTFMAGLIAGGGAPGATPIGMAPQANVLSVKVAGRDGAADVSTVLAGIQWVVSFRDRYDIRVLNLSLGTDSTQSWRKDPLNYAVERAWEAGILVTVAAANNGPDAGSIAKPADDPYVLTVGAVDNRGTPGLGDDRVPDFSSRGPTLEGIAKPDVVAPGARVLSLRAPGSTLDRFFPPVDLDSPYRPGSGTSMAAAVASGAAALVIEAHPDFTPNRLKHVLKASARPVASDDPSLVGSGLIDAYRAAERPAAGSANAGLPRSDGRGELGLSRGSLQMRTTGEPSTVLTGAQTARQSAQLALWDPVGFTIGSWTSSTWYTSANAVAGWNTAVWYGEFNGHNWTGHNWTGHNWTGHNWTGHNWTGHNWTGSSFYSQHEEQTDYGRHGEGSASYGAWG